MTSLRIYFHPDELAYTGVELRPHYLLSHFKLRGSAIAAFIGPCHVKTEHLVDWEDRMQGDFIQAKLMLHFLGEFFGISLPQGVLLQRLIMATLAESLNTKLKQRVTRSGDDLFVLDRKLSVSIVTASPVSQLLHIGLNLDPLGAPVPAVGLLELGETLDEIKRVWIPGILESLAREWDEIDWACAKVRPVV